MYPRAVSIWLFSCAAMIIAMVVLGGLTRLTHSGLSITEWKPVTGFLPPFTLEHWQALFNAYRASPEFIHLYPQMNLAEFKDIFWLEFIHRLVGRVAGCVFLLPLLYFTVKKHISLRFTFQLLGIFCLGGLQGGIGWLMVNSGLQDVPHVSHHWLAAHLLMASVILALILQAAFYSLSLEKEMVSTGIKYTARALLMLLFVQIGLGAWVAGLHAGLIFNTFPDMNGQMIPDDLLFLHPWYRNILENPTMVQFLHRLGAYSVIVVGAILLGLVWHGRLKQGLFKRWVYMLAMVILLQVALGIVTLLFQVPLLVALLHQLMALILFAITLFVNYILKN